ncbi:hypothetical protein PVK06_023656 [Gossypium arboreum]|uniref:Retrotransposon gag domain-containing protein n=1 Tax=Gossypium arboreum TaxID=29729 RepID=A0ABR0PC28_GOSAR|nr:hypothetical protein PVK06_023656 [Gossypium arboreum]
MMVNSLFTADTSAKQSQFHQELYSLKKGSLSIRNYAEKIKGLCALFAASGSHILKAERTAVMLASLSFEFDAVVSSASLSSSPLLFQHLVDALHECKARQARNVREVVFAANLVEGP